MHRPLIDWSLALSMLRARSCRPLSYWARQCHMDWRTIHRLARGETCSPRFDQGVLLLDCCADHFSESDWRRVRATLNTEALK